MRTLHFKQGHVGRGQGASAMAAAAYDSGEVLTDARTGRTWSYDKPDLVASGILAPEGCEGLPVLQTRENLWNGVESAEDDWARRHYAPAERRARAFLDGQTGKSLAGDIRIPPGLDPKGEAAFVKGVMQREVRVLFPPKESGLLLSQSVIEGQDGQRVLRWRAMTPMEHHQETARTALRFVIALPRDLDEDQQKQLSETWLQERFVRHGYVADYAIHRTVGNPHLHCRVTRRPLNPDGSWGDIKDRGVVTEDGLRENRRSYVQAANAAMAAAGQEARFDWRSYEEAGIDLIPTIHEGYWSRKVALAGEISQARIHNAQVRVANAEAVAIDPDLIVKEVARNRATFAERDLKGELWRRVQGDEAAFLAVTERLLASDLIEHVGAEPDGTARFALKEYLEAERSMFSSAEALRRRSGHPVDRARLDASMAQGGSFAMLSEEQAAAVRQITGHGDLALLVGRAGAGKTTLLRAARTEWEASGWRVRGAAPTGKAADGLSREAGIKDSRTIQAMFHGEDGLPDLRRRLEMARDPATVARLRLQIAKAESDRLTDKDVVVVDEAGMADTGLLERLLRTSREAGAKVVLVGDPDQIQAIGAGSGAFRGLVDAVGASYVETIRRQRADTSDGEDPDWMRKASEALARGEVKPAVEAYAARGRVAFADDTDACVRTLAQKWWDERRANPGASQLAMAYTKADVAALNKELRDRRVVAGELPGPSTMIENRPWAKGDRIVFEVNDNGGRKVANVAQGQAEVGVKNGALGTVVSIGPGAKGPVFRVTLDEGGREVQFATADYADFSHGYATTVHKSQGATVDRAYLLATSRLGRNLAYVGMTRHRDGLFVAAPKADLPNLAALGRALGRPGESDLARDYEIAGPHAADLARIFEYRRVGARAAQLAARMQQDIPGDGTWGQHPLWKDYASARDAKRKLAGSLADDLTAHGEAVRGGMVDGPERRRLLAVATFAQKANLELVRLEADAGRQPRPRTLLEARGEERVAAYAELVRDAGRLWRDIETTHAGELAREHPDYKLFLSRQARRDALASEIAADRGPHRRPLHAVRLNWEGVERHAEAHKRRINRVARGEADRPRVEAEAMMARFLEAKRAAGRLYAGIAEHRKAQGGTARDHPEFPKYRVAQAQADELAARLRDGGEAEKGAVAAANRRGALKDGEVERMADRHDARVLVARYGELSKAGNAEAKAVAAEIARLAGERDPGFKLVVEESGRAQDIAIAARQAVAAREAAAAAEGSGGTSDGRFANLTRALDGLEAVTAGGVASMAEAVEAARQAAAVMKATAARLEKAGLDERGVDDALRPAMQRAVNAARRFPQRPGDASLDGIVAEARPAAAAPPFKGRTEAERQAARIATRVSPQARTASVVHQRQAWMARQAAAAASPEPRDSAPVVTQIRA